jgi:Hemerythrin HHE cation binding domain
MANRLDQIISKGAGLAHEVKARMDGLVGVFNTLAEQHAEAGALLKRAKADESKRSELWPTIRAALKSHEQGELRVVYAALREHAELTALADHHAAEADQLSRTIDQMSALGARSPQFAIMLDRLIALVEAHAAEEETRTFPTAQSVLGDARARELDAQFLSVAKQIKQAEMPSEKH